MARPQNGGLRGCRRQPRKHAAHDRAHRTCARHAQFCPNFGIVSGKPRDPSIPLSVNLQFLPVILFSETRMTIVERMWRCARRACIASERFLLPRPGRN
jgi:hypothetical protein